MTSRLALSLVVIASMWTLRIDAQAPPRVALGAVSVDGPIPVAEARRVLAASLAAFQRCYGTRLRERPELAGRTTTRIFVSSDGGPIVAQVDRSDLGDPSLERCVRAAAMRLSFSEQDFADSHVRFDLRFGDSRRPSGEARTVTGGPEDPRFRSGDPAGSPGDPPEGLRSRVNSEVVTVRGSRGRDEVDAALRRIMPRVRSCYDAALSRDHRLSGDLRIRFAVEARGRARTLGVEDGVGDAALLACIRRVVGDMRLPARRQGSAEVVAKMRLRPPAGLVGRSTPRSG